MLFIFGVGAVADSLARIEIPILLTVCFPGRMRTNEEGGTDWMPT
jgi:hypothetical protein